MKYIVGKPFRSHLGQHSIGDEIADAGSWKAIESLINTGRVYRVHDGNYARLPAHIAKSAISRELAEAKLARVGSDNSQETPELVKEEVRLIKVQERSIRKAHEALVKRNEQRSAKAKDTGPVEESLPARQPRTDTRQAEAEAVSTEFNPEEIRTAKLEDLREMAKERNLTLSGNKPDLAQRIIDDEISKTRKSNSEKDAPKEDEEKGK